MGVKRISKAEFNWTGSEWAYLEDNLEDNIETIEHSGHDDVSIFLFLCLLFYVYNTLMKCSIYFFLIRDLKRENSFGN